MSVSYNLVIHRRGFISNGACANYLLNIHMTNLNKLNLIITTEIITLFLLSTTYKAVLLLAKLCLIAFY